MDDSFVPLALSQSSTRITVGFYPRSHLTIFTIVHWGRKYNSVTNEHGEIGGEGDYCS